MSEFRDILRTMLPGLVMVAVCFLIVGVFVAVLAVAEAIG